MISPVLLYLALAIGGVGVAISIPRKRYQAQLIGGIVAATGVGLLILPLGFTSLAREDGLPNPFFHVFAIIALGSCLQVITHRRPVYAVLYFVLSILASAGLYVLLAAEFMALALVAIYAGAILITYVFVIMLATQQPTEDDLDALAEYDAVGRGPLTATIASFALLAALTTMLFRGIDELPEPSAVDQIAVLDRIPGRVERVLEREELIQSGDRVLSVAAVAGEPRAIVETSGGGTRQVALPADLAPYNSEALGFNLLADYPGTIEIAGVLLLMAMVGAVVLARKFAQIDEEEKAAAAMAASDRLGGAGGGNDA
ncbi:MAG: NADH-quinone oxidoreductase subunit J [Planctomycetota bacterium]